MTEAASALVEAYFAYAGGVALTGSVRAENLASRRILIKNGFEEAGRTRRFFPLRAAELDMDLFRIDRANWSRGRPVLLPRSESGAAE